MMICDRCKKNERNDADIYVGSVQIEFISPVLHNANFEVDLCEDCYELLKTSVSELLNSSFRLADDEDMVGSDG